MLIFICCFLLLVHTVGSLVSIGIDVGTGSARAGVVDVSTGRLLATRKQAITTWSPLPEYYQQSSNEIWDACANCVRGALKDAGIDASSVVGVGFDATCSLVCLDADQHPIGTDPTAPDESEQNVILWMDHRATPQADIINAMGHERLSTVGGTISPEMEVPKMSWLRENMPDAFSRANSGKFLDLADYLAYRATDYTSDVRSLCTIVCKWAYDARADGTGLGWDRSFLRAVGFADDELLPSCIGDVVQAPGTAIEGGIGSLAASELGVPAGTPLAVGMIDAHAGGIGCLGIKLPEDPPLTGRLALIAGTSPCHMASTREPKFVSGVWGPYYSAMVPSLYLNEGGQSAAGALIDHVIESHAAFTELKGAAEAHGESNVAFLNRRLSDLAKQQGKAVAMLAADLHVTPDYAGNRSPLADPRMRGVIVGLGLTATLDDLAIQYLATVQALAYQTRAIVEALAYDDPPITAVIACGGLSKNPLFMQTHADVLRLPIHTAQQEEAVLLGAAILGAAAGGAHASIELAMANMNAIGETVWPIAAVETYHEKKYTVFHKMNAAQADYRNIMAEADQS